MKKRIWPKSFLLEMTNQKTPDTRHVDETEQVFVHYKPIKDTIFDLKRNVGLFFFIKI